MIDKAAKVICFPIVILWNVRTSLRKKLMLSGIFALVGFTIAVTIVRGSVFGGIYKNLDDSTLQVMNVTWIWFWFNMEFMVGKFLCRGRLPEPNILKPR